MKLINQNKMFGIRMLFNQPCKAMSRASKAKESHLNKQDAFMVGKGKKHMYSRDTKKATGY